MLCLETSKRDMDYPLELGRHALFQDNPISCNDENCDSIVIVVIIIIISISTINIIMILSITAI
jgi:hypothetical protein